MSSPNSPSLKYRQGLPNFFIIGAPKCGTTALHYYLSQHPDIFMGSVKEPHFFASDLDAPQYVKSASRYEALFGGFSGEKCVGEASPLYLFSSMASRNIADYLPSSKVIIMLRNPIEVAYSLHSGLVANGRENIQSFEQALDAEKGRVAGIISSKSAVPSSVVLYRQVVSFGEQIQRVFSSFNRDQVHIIFYDDFRRDTQAEVSKVHAFLGVAKTSVDDTSVKNKNKTSRLRFVWGWWMNLPPHVRAGISKTIPKFLRVALLRVNTKEEDRPSLAKETEVKLFTELKVDVDLLARLTQRDLSNWMKV